MQSIFDTDEFRDYANRWHSRQTELTRRKGYYDGSVYTQAMQRVLRNAPALYPRLYAGIKPLYLPLAGAVDIDAGLIPGGWAWKEDAPDSWEDARKQVFDWSRWRTQGVLYVHYGATFGATGIKVADLRERGQVQIIPVSPEYFMLVESGDYDPTPAIGFWLEHRQGPDGLIEYAEVITAQEIRTFLDGKPASVAGRSEIYPNELGFVPIVEARHKETGHPLGECTYQLTIPMLDECNQMASYVGDTINKNVEPQMVISGAESSDLTKSGDVTWFLPNPQAKATALVPNLDIAGVMQFIQWMGQNVKDSLPETDYAVMKDKAQVTTQTLEIQLGGLVVKIKRCRPNYDQGLIDALRMAGRAAATMGLSDVAVLDDEALTFDEERPVLPVNPLDKIALESAELGLEMQRSMGEGDGMPGGGQVTGQRRDRSLERGSDGDNPTTR